MFIKLTKFDSRPVWLNAAFIVTVEPRRDGNGAIVVPIGDGLDYDVRESPEDVLRLLGGAPAPTVVPVPVSDCLTKTPADVPAVEPVAAETPVEETKPKKRATRGRAKASAAPKAAKESAKESAKASAEASTEAVAEPPVEASPVASVEPPKAELDLSEADVLRLRKLGPKTLRKLKNTLVTQFMVADIGATVAALAAKGVLTLDGNKVLWTAEAQG